MKKIISLLLALAIPLYALPLAAGAAGKVHDLASGTDLITYLENSTNNVQDGDIIKCSGSVFAGQSGNTSDNPWIIDKSVTIEGGSISVYRGGILLGANVTFKGTEFTFTTSTRNAIIANGYSLTLDSVTAKGSSINVFGGTLLKNSYENFDVPNIGSTNTITIQGSTNLQGNDQQTNVVGSGNIYAGSLCMGAMNPTDNFDGTANTFSGNPTLRIENYANAGGGVLPLGTIYAGGAQQRNPAGVQGSKQTRPDPNKYKVGGTVTITGAKIPDVDGAGATKTKVVYNASPNSTPTCVFKDISSLTVEAGKLIMGANSSFRDEQELSVRSGAELNITGCTTPVGNFAGGGTLVLGEKQQLTINGTVSGKTKVGIKSILSGASQGSAGVGDILIHAPNSQDNSFSLVPLKAPNASFKIQRETNGDWKVIDPNAGAEQKILVKSLAANTPKVNDNKTEVEIPYTVEFEGSNSGDYLFFVRLSVLPNNATASSKQDENDYYYYTWTNSDGSFVLELDENNFIFRMNDNTPIPAGNYRFNITVPKGNSATGQAITTQFAVTIPTGGETPTPTPTPTPSPSPSPEPGKPTSIAIPVAKTVLKYTGKELTGVEAGTGYTLVGNTATEIGEYTATAALRDTKKFQWADGTTDAKQIKWSIGKGAAPAAPTGLKATSPTKKDGRDGQISGTTDKMEYATNSGFTNAKDCTGNTITGLPAGTYYVRVKETNKFEAGSYAVVKVLAFGEVEEVPVPPVEVKIPVSGEEKTVEVVASIKDSTAVVSTIDTTQLGSVIGEKVDTGMVLIDFSGLEQEIDTVELPGAAIGEIAAAAQAQGNDVEGLSLKLSTGSVSFDAAALASIQKQAGSKVTLKILAKDRHDLTPEQLESIGTAPAFDLSLQGNAAITDFGKGKATVSLPYTLKPGQSAAGITVYHLDEKGKAAACPTRYSQVEKAATYTTSHFSLYFVGFDSAIQWKNPFNDVRKGDWFYGAVEFAELNGLMQGDSKTVFSPNQKLSRAQLAQILYNKEGRPWVSGGSSFTDVPAKEWYVNAVNWAAQKGYVMGYDGTHFGPNDSVTREQLATILWRYAGEPKAKKSALSSFTDAGKASEYALPALRWAVQNGIVRGKGNNRLDPTGTATRAEVAQMLMNFLA